jgi:hypothetical protein
MQTKTWISNCISTGILECNIQNRLKIIVLIWINPDILIIKL